MLSTYHNHIQEAYTLSHSFRILKAYVMKYCTWDRDDILCMVGMVLHKDQDKDDYNGIISKLLQYMNPIGTYEQSKVLEHASSQGDRSHFYRWISTSYQENRSYIPHNTSWYNACARTTNMVLARKLCCPTNTFKLTMYGHGFMQWLQTSQQSRPHLNPWEHTWRQGSKQRSVCSSADAQPKKHQYQWHMMKDIFIGIS